MKRSKNFGDIIIDIFIFLFYLMFIFGYIGIIIYIFTDYELNYHIFDEEAFVFSLMNIGGISFFISLLNRKSNYFVRNIKNSILMFVISVVFGILLVVLLNDFHI